MRRSADLWQLNLASLEVEAVDDVDDVRLDRLAAEEGRVPRGVQAQQGRGPRRGDLNTVQREREVEVVQARGEVGRARVADRRGVGRAAVWQKGVRFTGPAARRSRTAARARGAPPRGKQRLHAPRRRQR